VLPIALTADRGGKWSIGGGDASSFSAPDVFGIMSFGAKDFENPADAGGDNGYSTTVTFTPRNLAVPPVTGALVVNVTNEDDGFGDNFNRAEEPLEAPGSGWTRVDAGTGTATLRTYNNRVGGSGGTSGGVWLAPQTGDTHELEITFTHHLSSTSESSTGLWMLQYKDDTNYVGLSLNVGVWRAFTVINGVRTTYNFNLYRSHAVGDQYRLQRRGNVLRGYQNGVLCLEQDIGAVLLDAKRSGVRPGTSSSTNGLWDNWNNRIAPVRTSALAFRAITWESTAATALTEAPSAFGSAKIAGYTLGSAITLGAIVAPAGSTAVFKADGDTIRWEALGSGLAAGTYSATVPVIESDTSGLGAINGPRTTNLTINFTVA
jgi:hypothetical protein